MKKTKEFNKLFPFEYVGGGYFRLKEIPKKKSAPVLHGQEAVEYLYNAMKKENEDLHITI